MHIRKRSFAGKMFLHMEGDFGGFLAGVTSTKCFNIQTQMLIVLKMHFLIDFSFLLITKEQTTLLCGSYCMTTIVLKSCVCGLSFPNFVLFPYMYKKMI